MGACLDLLAQAARMLTIEANAVSDNPLVFAEDGAVLSGGNFHAEPVAFAADMMAMAIAEIGSLSERRIAALIDSSISLLPPFLIRNPGLNSGFMIPQCTAAALMSENKQMSHPASVDSAPTSANQEDHVSMATHGARRLGPMNANLARIIAIELMAAAEGLEFRRPLLFLRTCWRRPMPSSAARRRGATRTANSPPTPRPWPSSSRRGPSRASCRGFSPSSAVASLTA